MKYVASIEERRITYCFPEGDFRNKIWKNKQTNNSNTPTPRQMLTYWALCFKFGILKGQFIWWQTSRFINCLISMILAFILWLCSTSVNGWSKESSGLCVSRCLALIDLALSQHIKWTQCIYTSVWLFRDMQLCPSHIHLQIILAVAQFAQNSNIVYQEWHNQ